MDYARTGRAR